MTSTKSPSYVGVNIYMASEGELRTIPGVGKIISRAILKLRGEVPVITREILLDIPMLRGNNDFWAIIDLDKPEVQSPSTPPPMSDLVIGAEIEENGKRSGTTPVTEYSPRVLDQPPDQETGGSKSDQLKSNGPGTPVCDSDQRIPAQNI